jgi:hypothetical protein
MARERSSLYLALIFFSIFPAPHYLVPAFPGMAGTFRRFQKGRGGW